jgi:hypothetical protein
MLHLLRGKFLKLALEINLILHKFVSGKCFLAQCLVDEGGEGKRAPDMDVAEGRDFFNSRHGHLGWGSDVPLSHSTGEDLGVSIVTEKGVGTLERRDYSEAGKGGREGGKRSRRRRERRRERGQGCIHVVTEKGPLVAKGLLKRVTSSQLLPILSGHLPFFMTNNQDKDAELVVFCGIGCR